MRCGNCKRVIREFDGHWYHTWWLDDPQDRMRKVMAGNSECNWKADPKWPALHAIPADSGPAQAVQGEAERDSSLAAPVPPGPSGGGLAQADSWRS